MPKVLAVSLVSLVTTAMIASRFSRTKSRKLCLAVSWRRRAEMRSSNRAIARC